MYQPQGQGNSNGLTMIATGIAVAALLLCFVAMVLPVSEGWNDLNFEGNNLGVGASAPDLIDFGASGGLRGRAFDGTATLEQMYGGGEVPHGYKEGSAIYPHVHWMPTTDDAGNVTWYLEYSWTNRDSPLTAPTTLSVTVPATSAWNITRADFPPIDGAGYRLGSHISFRLYRDPAATTDTYAHDAALDSVGFHIQTDSAGSETINGK